MVSAEVWWRGDVGSPLLASMFSKKVGEMLSLGKAGLLETLRRVADACNATVVCLRRENPAGPVTSVARFPPATQRLRPETLKTGLALEDFHSQESTLEEERDRRHLQKSTTTDSGTGAQKGCVTFSKSQSQ